MCITGASSGIGRATATLLSSYGAKVFGTGRNEEALKSLDALVGYLAVDLGNEGACQQVVDAASAHMGGLTTIVNSAGVLKGGAMQDADLEVSVLDTLDMLGLTPSGRQSELYADSMPHSTDSHNTHATHTHTPS